MAKTKVKPSQNGTTPAPFQFVEFKTRHIVAWTDAFNELGGTEKIGSMPIAAATVQALHLAGCLEYPQWGTTDEVLDESPALIRAIHTAFGEAYNKAMGIDPN